MPICENCHTFNRSKFKGVFAEEDFNSMILYDVTRFMTKYVNNVEKTISKIRHYFSESFPWNDVSSKTKKYKREIKLKNHGFKPPTKPKKEYINIDPNDKQKLEDLLNKINGYVDLITYANNIFSNILSLKLSARTIDDYYYSINLFYKLHSMLYHNFNNVLQTDKNIAKNYLNILGPIYEQVLNQKENRKISTIQKILSQYNELIKLAEGKNNYTEQKSGGNFEVYRPIHINKYTAKVEDNNNGRITMNEWPDNINNLKSKINENVLLAFVELFHDKLKKRRYGIPNWDIVITDPDLLEMGFNTIRFDDFNKQIVCRLIGDKFSAKFLIPSQLTNDIRFNYAYAYCLIIFIDTVTCSEGFTRVHSANKIMLKLTEFKRILSPRKIKKQKTIKLIPRKISSFKNHNKTFSLKRQAIRPTLVYVPWHLRILPAGRNRSLDAVKKAKLKGINLLSENYNGLTFVSEYIKGNASDEDINRKLVHIRSMSIYSFIRSVIS